MGKPAVLSYKSQTVSPCPHAAGTDVCLGKIANSTCECAKQNREHPTHEVCSRGAPGGLSMAWAHYIGKKKEVARNLAKTQQQAQVSA